MAELVESFLEQSPACFWIVKGSGAAGKRSSTRHERLVFERVWGRTMPLFDRSLEELNGVACSAALAQESAPLWCERFERAMEGATLLLRERRGDAVWFVSLFPIRVDGDDAWAGGIGREITQWNVAEQQLRHTVLGALKAQEFERSMMSRFLHDSVGQNLTALGLQLDLIRMDIETVAPEVGQRVTEVQKALGEMMEAVREYSYELNPSTVERAGLRSALDRLAVRSRDRFTGAIRVNVDPSLKVEPGLASALFQIAQEAVENAVQYSGAAAIDITLKTTRSSTVLEVRDNGRGFDPDNIEGGCRGLGLLSMEHYAAQAGLELSIVSARDVGTTVRARRE
jgi:two-component system NarL family sensor kinase